MKLVLHAVSTQKSSSTPLTPRSRCDFVDRSGSPSVIATYTEPAPAAEVSALATPPELSPARCDAPRPGVDIHSMGAEMTAAPSSSSS